MFLGMEKVNTFVLAFFMDVCFGEWRVEMVCRDR